MGRGTEKIYGVDPDRVVCGFKIGYEARLRGYDEEKFRRYLEEFLCEAQVEEVVAFHELLLAVRDAKKNTTSLEIAVLITERQKNEEMRRGEAAYENPKILPVSTYFSSCSLFKYCTMRISQLEEKLPEDSS